MIPARPLEVDRLVVERCIAQARRRRWPPAELVHLSCWCYAARPEFVKLLGVIYHVADRRLSVYGFSARPLLCQALLRLY